VSAEDPLQPPHELLLPQRLPLHHRQLAHRRRVGEPQEPLDRLVVFAAQFPPLLDQQVHVPGQKVNALPALGPLCPLLVLPLSLLREVRVLVLEGCGCSPEHGEVNLAEADLGHRVTPLYRPVLGWPFWLQLAYLQLLVDHGNTQAPRLTALVRLSQLGLLHEGGVFVQGSLMQRVY
jgi:hypothetical protein